MKKLLTVLIAMMLITCMTCNLAASAEEVEDVWSLYTQKTQALSDEAVELHIGLTTETVANNALLEQAFFLKYPNGKIIYHLYSTDQLNAYLLSGSSELDLLLISDSTRKTLASQNVLRNLYDTELMTQWPNIWLDAHQQLEAEDGKLYGFPRSIEVGYLSWYDDLGTQVGIEKPGTLWTWDDFAAMATDVNYDVDGNGIKDFCLKQGMYITDGMNGFISTPLEVYTYQCVLQGESFSSEEFNRLLNQFVQVYQSQALNADGITMYQERDAQLIVEMTEPGNTFFLPDGYSYLNFPTLYKDSPAYLGRSYVFALLNNAPHESVALDFLQTSLELCEQQICESYTTYMNQAVPAAFVSAFDNSDSIGFSTSEDGEMVLVRQKGDHTVQVQTDPTALSDEDFASYNFMRANFLPITGQWYSVSSVLYEMIPQYLSGTVTMDQITAAMDQRIRMMQNE